MDAPRVIRCEPLTRQAFAPFGDVIEASGGGGRDANLGTAKRRDWLTALENLRPGARANVAVFRSRAQALPFTVTMLERHSHSTQLFAPLVAIRFLVVVAPTSSDGEPTVEGTRAFVGVAGQGVNYRPGTWHHPILALESAAELLMIAFEDLSPADCEERRLDLSLTVLP